MFDVNLLAEPQFRFVDLIDSIDSSNGESDTWSCRSEKCISLEGLRKCLTLILWQSPNFALSIRSIRSIRRMVNPTRGVVDRKSASH